MGVIPLIRFLTAAFALHGLRGERSYMRKEFLVVDSGGTVLVHFDGRGLPCDGLHFASVRDLPHSCKSAIESLMNETGAGDRHENRAVRQVVEGDTEYIIRLVEAIRIERVECNLKRALSEALDGLALEAQESRVQLQVQMSRDLPEKVLVDPDKLVWVTMSLVRAAVTYSLKGSVLKSGGKVCVELTYDGVKNLLSMLIEDNAQGKEVQNPWPLHIGENSGSGKLIRAIVEAHGGILIWESVPAEHRMGTRVSFTLPVL